MSLWRWRLSLVWHSGLIIWVDRLPKVLMFDELGMRIKMFFFSQNQLLYLLRWTFKVKSCSRETNTFDPQISNCRQKTYNRVETRPEKTKISHNQINEYINRKLQKEKVAVWETLNEKKNYWQAEETPPRVQLKSTNWSTEVWTFRDSRSNQTFT